MWLSRRTLLVALAALVSVGSARAEGPYQREIDAFVKADATAPPAPGQVLFVGSSSIRMWQTLADDMAPLDVVRRGFGGAHVRHVSHWVEQIVLPYQPREIVVYAGDNDVHHGRTPEQTAADFAALVARVRADLPAVRFTFLTIKPSVARWDDWPAMASANALISAQAAADEGLRVVDVSSPMLGSDGKPRPELFATDGLHMSPAGYALWTSVLKPILQ